MNQKAMSTAVWIVGFMLLYATMVIFAEEVYWGVGTLLSWVVSQW